MFILDFIAGWISPILIAGGLIGLFFTEIASIFSFLPLSPLTPYTKAIRIIAILMLIGGVWLNGYHYKDEAVDKEIAELKQKVKEAEAKSQQENVKIVEKIVEKIKYIKEQQDSVQQYIDANVQDSCVVSPNAIKAHNAAAKNVKVEDTK